MYHGTWDTWRHFSKRSTYNTCFFNMVPCCLFLIFLILLNQRISIILHLWYVILFFKTSHNLHHDATNSGARIDLLCRFVVTRITFREHNKIKRNIANTYIYCKTTLLCMYYLYTYIASDIEQFKMYFTFLLLLKKKTKTKKHEIPVAWFNGLGKNNNAQTEYLQYFCNRLICVNTF